MDIVERLKLLRLNNEDYEVVVDAIDEIERLRETLKLERQLRDDALRAFNEARAALKEGE